MTTIYDAVEISKPHLTRDGYLVAEARVARTGIQLYRADEVGFDGEPDRAIRVYRPPEEVFAKDAMASYAFRPVTVNHPPVMVDASNWKEYSRGQTSGDILRDGEYVRVPLILMDAAAIDDWRRGVKELSMGYTMDLEIVDGTTPEGEQYDAVQRNLRMNHLALVPRARGGSQLKLGDNNLEDSHMSEVKLTTIMVDGLSVQTTDAGAQAIAKLEKVIADQRTTAGNLANDHTGALAAKDKDLAAKDAEIDSLKSKVLDEAALDARVKERADLIAKAKTVADKDYSGLTADQIRQAAVAAKLGQATVDGKSVDYVSARFDILVEDASQDPVRKMLRNGDATAPSSADAAHAAYVAGLSTAYLAKEVQ